MLMWFFDTFRIHGGPTLYPSNKTPVTIDVVECGIAFSLLVLFITFVIALLGFSERTKSVMLLRAVFEGFVLASIIVCNFGQDWETASVHDIHTHYKAQTSNVIKNASIAVKIGLRSVNITLKTNPVEYKIDNKTLEIINYNERFHWNDPGWTQGLGGFGPCATLINQEYRAAQLKGTPFPILWIAEYFTIDGEGIRWGRFYREAGYFTHILLWLAFATWILTIFLFKNVLIFASYSSAITGLVLLLGNIIYATVRNPLQLEIHIGDGLLTFHWGWAFWLTLCNGILTVTLGIIVWYMYERYPEALHHFFHVDILKDIEEFYFSPCEMANDEERELKILTAMKPEYYTIDEAHPDRIIRGTRRNHEHYYFLKPRRPPSVPALGHHGNQSPEYMPPSDEGHTQRFLRVPSMGQGKDNASFQIEKPATPDAYF